MINTSAGDIPWFDGHCDTVSRCAHLGWKLRENPGHLDLARLGRYKKAAQVFAIFADSARVPGGDMMGECRRQREVFIRQLEENRDAALFCPGGRGIEAAHGEGKIAALLSIEGGELLDCDPDNLALAAFWGVRLVNITWNHANALSGSNIDDADRGLTDRGRAFVQQAEALGILMDVSHLSDRGFWDLAEMTAQPLVATHSNARAVCAHPRNVTDDMFRAIRDSGGTAGLNMYKAFIGPEPTLEQLIRHVEHCMELDGAKTLALGGDWDGCELGCDFHGVEDMPRLWDALAARGYPQNVLEDIFFNNLSRVLEQKQS